MKALCFLTIAALLFASCSKSSDTATNTTVTVVTPVTSAVYKWSMYNGTYIPLAGSINIYYYLYPSTLEFRSDGKAYLEYIEPSLLITRDTVTYNISNDTIRTGVSAKASTVLNSKVYKIMSLSSTQMVLKQNMYTSSSIYYGYGLDTLKR